MRVGRGSRFSKTALRQQKGRTRASISAWSRRKLQSLFSIVHASVGCCHVLVVLKRAPQVWQQPLFHSKTAPETESAHAWTIHKPLYYDVACTLTSPAQRKNNQINKYITTYGYMYTHIYIYTYIYRVYFYIYLYTCT